MADLPTYQRMTNKDNLVVVIDIPLKKGEFLDLQKDLKDTGIEVKEGFVYNHGHMYDEDNRSSRIEVLKSNYDQVKDGIKDALEKKGLVEPEVKPEIKVEKEPEVKREPESIPEVDARNLQDLKVSDTQRYAGGAQVNSQSDKNADTNTTQLVRMTNAADVSNSMQTVRTDAKKVLVASDTLDDGTKGVFVDKKGQVTAADTEGARKVGEGDRNTYVTSMTKDGQYGKDAPEIVVTLTKDDLEKISNIQSQRAAADNGAERVVITYNDGHTATLIGGNVKLAMDSKDAKDFGDDKLRSASNDSLAQLRTEQNVDGPAVGVGGSKTASTAMKPGAEVIGTFTDANGQTSAVTKEKDGSWKLDSTVATGEGTMKYDSAKYGAQKEIKLVATVDGHVTAPQVGKGQAATQGSGVGA